MGKTTIAVLALMILATQACAEPQEMNLDKKWSYNAKNSIGATVLVDGGGTGKKEVAIGLQNDTVIIRDQSGNKKGEFYIGNASQIGGVYAMAAADIDGDGKEELIMGLGGAKEIRTYEQSNFDVKDTGLTAMDKVLYRVTRYHGAVYVMKTDGSILWRYLTDDSVKAVTYIPGTLGQGYIAAGVGDLAIYTYNEKETGTINGTTCYTDTVSDEISTWSDKASCINQGICCERKAKCRCHWDETCVDDACTKSHDGNCYKNASDLNSICSGGTKDVCLMTYDKIKCEKNVDASLLGYQLNDYQYKNGTILFLDKNGKYRKEYPIEVKDDKGAPVKGADNNIRTLQISDLRGDKNYELLVTSNNGEVMALNITNLDSINKDWNAREEYLKWKKTGDVAWEYGIEVTAANSGDINNDGKQEVTTGNSRGLIATYDNEGKLIWRQRVDEAITGVSMADIEMDGIKDIVVAARNGRLYVYDASGDQKWVFQHTEQVYGLQVTDLDANDQEDFILSGTNNVTRYEINEYYIKKFKADTYYNTANEKFQSGDFTSASVFIDKAIDAYNGINDKDDLSKCKNLRDKIDEEFKSVEKQKADKFYNLALKYYSMNDFDNANNYLNEARKVYQSLGNDEGVTKCDQMSDTMKDELKQHRKLEADGQYNRAVTLINFGNFTGALQLIDSAKQVYDDLGYKNESTQCDILVIKIADKNYLTAMTAFDAKDFQRALDYALRASELYKKVGSLNASFNADELARNANASIGKVIITPETETDYTPYLVGIIVLVIVIIIALRAQGLKGRRKMDMKGYDEDLEMLEKGGE